MSEFMLDSGHHWMQDCDSCGGYFHTGKRPECADETGAPDFTCEHCEEQAAVIEALKQATSNPPTSSENSPSGQVADDEHLCKTVLNVANAGPSGPISDDCYAALSRLARKAQGYEAMKAERDAATARAAKAEADALAIAQSAEETVKERDAINAEVARVSREHQDKIDALEAEKVGWATSLEQRTMAAEAECVRLKAELARLTPSGQVAEDRRKVYEAIHSSSIHPEDVDALDRLAAQANGYEAMKAERDAAVSTLATAQHEVAQMDAALRVMVPEIEAMLISTCVWCGTPAPQPTTPETLRAHVIEHVTVCEKHPIRSLEAERDAAVERAKVEITKAITAESERDAAQQALAKHAEEKADLQRDVHEARVLASTLRSSVTALQGRLAEYADACANALGAEASTDTPRDVAAALKRARNDGIERVAKVNDEAAIAARQKEAEYAGQPIAREWAREAARYENEAASIRRLKEKTDD